MSEIILTNDQALSRICPLSGGAGGMKFCKAPICMFWGATNRMDTMQIGYCSLATIARKVCEEDWHIEEVLDVVRPAGEAPVRRIDMPIRDGEEVLATPVDEHGGEVSSTQRLRIARSPRTPNQN